MESKKIHNIPLGKNGPLVPRIGLGCMGMSAFYGTPPPEAELQKLLNRSIDLGCTLLDTADIYGNNEELLSTILGTRRDEIFLCTKFGAFVFDEKDKEKFAKCPGNPEYVRICVERSLRRLAVSCIDLYYLHRVDSNTPIEETVGAMSALVKEGKLRYLGLSECSADTLRRACAVHPISAVQVEYSPWSIDIETNGLLEACRELGVALVAYSPLGRGFLSGKFKSISDLEAGDWRLTNPRFQGDNFAKNYQIVEEFHKIASELKITPSQVVLAWVLAQSDNIIVIPGTTNQSRLEENLAADTMVLSQEAIQKIRDIITSIGVTGGRYEDSTLNRCNI